MVKDSYKKRLKLEEKIRWMRAKRKEEEKFMEYIENEKHKRKGKQKL